MSQNKTLGINVRCLEDARVHEDEMQDEWLSRTLWDQHTKRPVEWRARKPSFQSERTPETTEERKKTRKIKLSKKNLMNFVSLHVILLFSFFGYEHFYEHMFLDACRCVPSISIEFLCFLYYFNLFIHIFYFLLSFFLVASVRAFVFIYHIFAFFFLLYCVCCFIVIIICFTSIELSDISASLSVLIL